LRAWAGLLAGLAVALGAAAAVAAWWLPAWLQERLVGEASQRLGRVVTLERLELSWLTPGVTLHGMQVAAAAGSVAPQFELQRLRLAVSWASLMRLAPVIQALEVDAPRLRVARLEGGRTDLDDVLARLGRDAPVPQPAPEARQAPPRFSVSGVRVAQGVVEFDDRAAGQLFRLSGVRLDLPGLSTLDGAEAAQAEPRLAFTLDGTPVEVSASVRPFAAVPGATVALSLAQPLPLERAWAYLPAGSGGWPGRPEGGQLTAALRASLAQPAGQALQWQLAGQAALTDLAWRPAPGADAMGWKRLAIEGLDLSGHERRVALAGVQLDGPRLEFGRDRRGRLTVGGRAVPDAPAPPSAPAPTQPQAQAQAPAQQEPPWRVEVGRMTVGAARIGWTDATTAPTARLRVEELAASAGPLAWPGGEPVAFEVAARVGAAAGPAAPLRVKGRWSPEGAAAEVQLEGLPLEALSAYLAGTLGPTLAGRVGLAATVQLRSEPALDVGLRLQALRVDGLRLTERGAAAPAVLAQAVRVGEASVDFPAGRVRVGSLRVEAPEIWLVRAPTGTINARGWLLGSASSASAASAASSDRKSVV